MIDWAQYKPISCSSCTLQSQPGPCWGSGDEEKAKIIYIAQNPGQEEVNARPMQPLIGPSGRTFNRLLYEAGVKRGDLFCTNQVKCLTPGNREPTDEEISHCRPLLERELGRVKADTVVLAGSVAFQANIGSYSTLSPDYHPSTSLFERMGCVEQRGGRKWIATVHPAHVMRFSGTSIYGETVDHLRKAARVAGKRIPIPIIIESPSQSDIERHRDSAIANGIFADDVEAYRPAGVTDEDEVVDPGWVMDICGFSAVEYEAIVLDKKDLASAWGEVWSSPDVVQAEHNGESDRFHLEQIVAQKNTRWDTMLAHHFLHNNIHKYLKPECLRTYTDLPYYNRDIEDMVSRKFYCGMDNIATLLIAKEQIRQMKADLYKDVRGVEGEIGKLFFGRMYDLMVGKAFPGEPPLMKMLPLLEEQRRVGINTNLRTVLLFKVWLEHRVQETQQAIVDMIGPDFNWRSYSAGGDVQRLFYDTWGLPKQYKKNPKTNARKVTCDDEARKHMSEWIEASPARQTKFAEAYKYFRLAGDAASSNKLLEYITRIGGDGRIHALQKAHGTANFRIASKPNTQNWPDWPILRRCKSCGKTHPGAKLLKSVQCCGKEMPAGLPSMRAMVVPDNPEDLLLSVDFSGVEVWTYAAQFGIKYLLDIHARGEYIHGVVYEEVVGKQFFQEGKPRIKKNMTEAIGYGSLREAKAIPLGFLYGMEAGKLAFREGWVGQCRCNHHVDDHPIRKCSLCDCQGYSDKARYYAAEWRRLNPELYAAHDWIHYEMNQRKMLRIPPGLKMHFPTPDLQGINAYGSVPAAMLLWTSAILIDTAFKTHNLPRTRITHTVHDSLCMNIGGAATDWKKMKFVVEEIVRPVLTRPIPWLGGFRYECSEEVGKTWDWGMESYEKWAGKQSGD